MGLPEHTGVNDHAIKLEKNNQPSYSPIDSLGLVQLETLKRYIETHIKTGFIQSYKYFTRASIFFDQKQDGSLRLCVNYRELNNLNIKNRCFLPLIGETLDRLGQTNRFTQLDLVSTYYQMRI